MHKQHRHPVTGCRPASLVGAWAIQPQRFRYMYDLAMGVDLMALAERRKAAASTNGESAEPEPLYEMVTPDIARIQISGPMTKYTTSFDLMFGGCSTVAIRNAVRAAAADANVLGLFLDIDSPGGTVNGTPDLADEVADFRQCKPVVAYVSDLCCSAAYWVASQCDAIHTNSVGFVGNIGCYSVLEDSRGLQEKTGFKLTTIASAPFKGLGADGEVTDVLKEETQREVDQIHDLFVAAVAAGRKISPEQAKTLADGRALIGAHAVAVGLADRVCTIDESLESLIEYLAPADAVAAN